MKHYAVYTPPIDEMITQIGDWIDQQVPGAYIYGASRLGKTRGVKWFLESVLAERFGAVLPLVIWIRRPDNQKSEAEFWHQLLLASKFAFVDPNRPPKRSAGFHLCFERFIAIAKNAGSNQVVLLIDEAQDMRLQEWKWLTGLQNALDNGGFNLSVFSVGTHQLGYQHEYLASTGNAHIAARFMAAHSRFHGLRIAAELEFVLTGYDIDSEWPSGSGTTYLQHFAPVDFKAGHRLTQSAAVLWKAMEDLSPIKVKHKLEFPMQSVTRAVENVLMRLARDEPWSTVVDYDSWLTELTRANFADLMRVISTAG